MFQGIPRPEKVAAGSGEGGGKGLIWSLILGYLFLLMSCRRVPHRDRFTVIVFALGLIVVSCEPRCELCALRLALRSALCTFLVLCALRSALRSALSSDTATTTRVLRSSHL